MKTILFRLRLLAGVNRSSLSSFTSHCYSHPTRTCSCADRGILATIGMTGKGFFRKAFEANSAENLVALVERELKSGEKLLWSGKAGGGLRLRLSDAFLIPFSLLSCGFAFLTEWLVVCTRAPLFMQLLGIPFVLYSVHLVLGRFISDALARRKTFYRLSNERIFIISGLFFPRIRSLNLQTLTDISLSERRDGNGTITFGSAFPAGRRMIAGSWAWVCRGALPAFDIIQEAGRVYQIIRHAQAVCRANARTSTSQ